jgi:hypothetical protein
MTKISAKRTYQKPVLEYCGAVSERTLGGSGTRNDCGNSGQNWGEGGECPH